MHLPPPDRWLRRCRRLRAWQPAVGGKSFQGLRPRLPTRSGARVGSRFVVCVGVGAAVCAAVFVSPSQEATAALAACPSLTGVKAFSGSWSAAFTALASGEDPGENGAITIKLHRDATNMKINLATKATSKPLPIPVGPKLPGLSGFTAFIGKGSGGSVTVDDTYANSGTSLTGSLSGGAPPTYASVILTLWPRVCQYQLLLSFGGRGVASGDASVPGTSVRAAAFTPRRPIPRSLKLSGSVSVKAYGSGCANPGGPPDEAGCYEYAGGWDSDFDMLKRCKSDVAVNCAPDDAPQGAAHLSWNLKPIFGKKKK